MIGWSIRLRAVPVGPLCMQVAPFLGRAEWNISVAPSARRTP